MLRKIANCIRFLSVDAVNKANSGHPGAPMALADLMAVLYQKHLNHNPKNPHWINRDRFILSNGHASMLLYSTLHLRGYNLSIEDIKQFRQFDSNTPGHPELDVDRGIETTTGPLGQGFANAVGMAIAEKTLANQFNTIKLKVIDHHTYVVIGDGCLMEGISHEAASLAGVLRLNKLIVLWDDNGISIDGKLAAWQNENVTQRFEAYGFKVICNVDGHNCDEIDFAINEAKKSDKPVFIQIKTEIAYGSELAGNPKAHGSPLNDKQIAYSRELLGWQYPPFEVPEEVYEFFDGSAQGEKQEANWQKIFEQYFKQDPDKARELERRLKGKLPKNFSEKFEAILEKENQHLKDELQNLGAIKLSATRNASQKSLEYLKDDLPELFGGSADLTPSNLTTHSKSISINVDSSGNYCNYGVREFAMSAIMNGISLHGGFLPYGGTFLVFSDYARAAIRLAALMRVKVIYVFTHDSIGVGEDGPTHQPIEHLASLRLIPNLCVWRPCDSIETLVAYKHAIGYQGPSVLALSRQSIPNHLHSKNEIAFIKKGGYVIYQPILKENDRLDGLIIATGSEVALAIEVAKKYNDAGVFIRVVSMPCVDLFDSQTNEYKKSVLPNEVKNRLVIEAGVSKGWEKFAGEEGMIIAIDSFGKSAPASQVYRFFGITYDAVYQSLAELLSNQ